MALQAINSGTQTSVINTEHSLASSTGIGVYMLVVDTANMASGDTVVIRVKSKVRSGDSFQLAYSYTFTDDQTEQNKYSIPIPIDIEVACTLQQTAGSPRDYKWKLLRL